MLAENHRVEMAVKSWFYTRPYLSMSTTALVFVSTMAYAILKCDLAYTARREVEADYEDEPWVSKLP